MPQDGSTVSVLSIQLIERTLSSRANGTNQGAVFLRYICLSNFRNGVPPLATSMTDEILAKQVSEYADSESKTNEYAWLRVSCAARIAFGF